MALGIVVPLRAVEQVGKPNGHRLPITLAERIRRAESLLGSGHQSVDVVLMLSVAEYLCGFRGDVPT